MNLEDLFGFAVEMLPALQVCELFDRLQGLSAAAVEMIQKWDPSPVIG